MSDDDKKLYVEGNPNPDTMGFFTLTSMGHVYGIFDQITEKLCKELNKEKTYIDSDGYEIEIIASASQKAGVWAWMECRAKDIDGFVDITFTEYLFQDGKIVNSSEIETYNPYFGCDVSYMQWWGDSVITIYREKHNTYISSITLSGQENYFKIEDEWCLVEDKLYFRGYEESFVKVVRIPSLELLEKLSVEQARTANVLPELLYNES